MTTIQEARANTENEIIERNDAAVRYILNLGYGIECTCCGEPARKQCEDHDTGYGVCDKCLAKHGRKSFCESPSCKAH